MEKQRSAYSIKEAAERLGVSAQVMYRMCKQPGFPARHISPRRIVISAEGLETWLKEGTRAVQ